MDGFRYYVVASPLHDVGAVDSIFSSFSGFFSSMRGSRGDIGADGARQSGGGRGSAVPTAFFILTGGTEGILLHLLDELGLRKESWPIVLIAHPKQNSLPAALEILAKLEQDGGRGVLHLVESPEDEAAKEKILETMESISALQEMRRARIGAVGSPSDWLVASNHDPELVRKVWGPEIVPIPIERLLEAVNRIREIDSRKGGEGPLKPPETRASLSGEAVAFLENASFNRGPSIGDIYKSDTILRALTGIVKEESLSALTLRCFDLVEKDGSTGCFALSQLADDGIDAGCEGDIPSILGLHWMRALSGRAAWMANPSWVRFTGSAESGEILLAHCTVPRSGLLGYGIRTHFESGLGVGISGDFQKGGVTLLRIGGKDLRRVWVAEAELIGSQRDEGLCRTQAVVRGGKESLESLLASPLGNHIVVAAGHHGERIKRYLALAGLGG